MEGHEETINAVVLFYHVKDKGANQLSSIVIIPSSSPSWSSYHLVHSDHPIIYHDHPIIYPILYLSHLSAKACPLIATASADKTCRIFNYSNKALGEWPYDGDDGDVDMMMMTWRCVLLCSNRLQSISDVSWRYHHRHHSVMILSIKEHHIHTPPVIIIYHHHLSIYHYLSPPPYIYHHVSSIYHHHHLSFIYLSPPPSIYHHHHLSIYHHHHHLSFIIYHHLSFTVARLVDKTGSSSSAGHGNTSHSFAVTCIASHVDELNEVNYIITGGEDNVVKVRTLPYSTLPYSTLPYSTLPYSTPASLHN